MSNYAKYAMATGLIIIGITAIIQVFVNRQDASDLVSQETNIESEEELNSFMTDEEVLSVTNELLSIYYRLYFVTQSEDDGSETDSAVIMSMLTEAMKDKNELEKLVYRAESLQNHYNKIVSTTGLALYAGLVQLEVAHTNWINYLRTVDPYSSDLSEFTYQFTLFNTENKDAFFSIIEGVSYFPFIFVEFSEQDDGMNKMRISTETADKIVAEIDRLFSDIFIEHEQWNKETGNHNAVVIIVQNYRDFLNEGYKLK